MKLLLVAALVFSHTLSFAGEIDFKSLKIADAGKPSSDPFSAVRNIQSTNSEDCFLKSPKFWAWTTMVFLGATAATAKEKQATPTHKALAYFTVASYSSFAATYLNADKPTAANAESRKWVNRSFFLHLPAMALIPISGVNAEKEYNRGKSSAKGIGSAHAPLALAAALGMALTTAFLTWEF